MIPIGSMDKRITLQSVTKTSDGMGGFTDVWAAEATVWAKKTTHRSDEAVMARATTGIAIHNFRIRYRSDVKTDWRVMEGTKYMNIIGLTEIDDGPGRRFLDVTVKEVMS